MLGFTKRFLYTCTAAVALHVTSIVRGNFRLTAITQLTHHGMLFVPIGYTFGGGMFEMTQAKGGSPWGSGTFAGDGTRTPTELELQQAFHQGKLTAEIVKKLKH